MTRTILFLSMFLMLSCFVCEELITAHGIEPTIFGLTGRIVNGTKAILRQFPHQVSLKRSWSGSHFCGGSIISARLVLTAGHCMFLNGDLIQPWMIIVVAGELKLNEATATGQTRAVRKTRVHPHFVYRTLENDVAVLELSAPFKFTPEVRNVPLAASDPVPNTVCQVSGWGYPSQDIPIVSNDLMYVDLPIRDVGECRKLLANYTNMPPGMFCAGYLEGGRDACQGDSGGGMICNGILTGVVSGGEGCAYPRLPGIYSNVFYYLDWISNGEYIEAAYTIYVQVSHDSGALMAPSIIAVTASLLFLSLPITI